MFISESCVLEEKAATTKHNTHVEVYFRQLCSFDKWLVEILHIHCGVSCDSLDGSNMPQSSEYRSKNPGNPSLTDTFSFLLSFCSLFEEKGRAVSVFPYRVCLLLYVWPAPLIILFTFKSYNCTVSHHVWIPDQQQQISNPVKLGMFSIVEKKKKEVLTFFLQQKCIMLDYRIISNEYKHTWILSISSPWPNHGPTTFTHIVFSENVFSFTKGNLARAIYEICLLMWLVLVSFRSCFLINIKCWETQ